jgi:hypothetical protein
MTLLSIFSALFYLPSLGPRLSRTDVPASSQVPIPRLISCPFYFQAALDKTLAKIYTAHMDDANEYNPATDKVFNSRADIDERIIQFTPFNITDGIWLSGVHNTSKCWCSCPSKLCRSKLASLAIKLRDPTPKIEIHSTWSTVASLTFRSSSAALTARFFCHFSSVQIHKKKDSHSNLTNVLRRPSRRPDPVALLQLLQHSNAIPDAITARSITIHFPELDLTPPKRRALISIPGRVAQAAPWIRSSPCSFTFCRTSWGTATLPRTTATSGKTCAIRKASTPTRTAATSLPTTPASWTLHSRCRRTR